MEVPSGTGVICSRNCIEPDTSTEAPIKRRIRLFEANDILVPEGWSQVAVDILAQKYF
ncbi:hypothetical protein CH375_15555, partial [Leptospira ellisii]